MEGILDTRALGRWRRGAVLALCFGFALAALIYYPRAGFDWRWALAVSALVLVFEAIPVEIPSEKLYLTFSLPAICAAWVVCGTWSVLICPAMALFGLALHWQVQKRVAKCGLIFLRLAIMVGVLPIAAGAADFAGASIPATLRLPLEAGVFIVAYVAATTLAWLGVAGAGAYRVAHRLLSNSIWEWLIMFAIVVVAAVGLAAVVEHGHFWLLPVAAVSPFALRAVYAMRARMRLHREDALKLLTLMMQRAHPYTHGHIERVGLMAEDVAIRMGLNPAEARLVREAAILHDIGKIAVDEEILDFPGPLTADQLNHVRRHSIISSEILHDHPDFCEIAGWVRHHHERPDGTGYPDQLKDYEIEIPSKIIAVTDAYDAMVGGGHPNQKRPYRDSLSTEEATEELNRYSGSQFDPRVVAAFRSALVAQGVKA